jgi:hypothetical protein
LTFNAFNITDFISLFFWVFVLGLYIYLKYQKNKHLPHYRFYIPATLFKIFFAILFAAIYMFYYKGGDTVWYWDGATKMVNLFMKSPSLYFDQLFSNPNAEKYYNYFDVDTGYPPSWIYREPDSFYVCKIASVLGFITLKSFFSITLLFAFFAAHSAWKLYELIIHQKIASERNAAIAILFIPSVNFWASGIMKDTVVLSCAFYSIVVVYNIFVLKRKRVLNSIIGVFLMYWIFKTRAFMLICLIPCLIIWINYEVVAGIKNNIIRRLILPLLFIGMIGFTIALYISYGSSFGSYSAENIVNSALVIQKDFQGNTSYSENRYSLPEVDGSLQSMLFVAPAAITAAWYRPFIWETNTPLMVFNGLESLVFIFLTIRFLIRFRLFKWIAVIRGNRFLLFSFIFILLMGYFVGFTALIFGALVRFKAPILPFLVLILLIDKTSRIKRSVALPQPMS